MNIIASFFIALLVGISLFWAFSQMPKDKNYVIKKNEFMNSCLQDRKQYECDALWGQASRGR